MLIRRLAYLLCLFLEGSFVCECPNVRVVEKRGALFRALDGLLHVVGPLEAFALLGGFHKLRGDREPLVLSVQLSLLLL